MSKKKTANQFDLLFLKLYYSIRQSEVYTYRFIKILNRLYNLVTKVISTITNTPDTTNPLKTFPKTSANASLYLKFFYNIKPFCCEFRYSLIQIVFLLDDKLHILAHSNKIISVVYLFCKKVFDLLVSNYHLTGTYSPLEF